MLREKARVLETVSGEPIVRVGAAEVNRRLAVLPSKLSKRLTNLGGRELAPPVLAEQITRDIPAQSLFKVRTAMFEFARPAPEAAAVKLKCRSGLAQAVLGVDGDRAAQSVEPEQRIRSGHQCDL